MNYLRNGLVVLAALFLVGAISSFIGMFDQVENTTTSFAAASTACAFLAFAIRRAAENPH